MRSFDGTLEESRGEGCARVEEDVGGESAWDEEEREGEARTGERAATLSAVPFLETGRLLGTMSRDAHSCFSYTWTRLER